MSEGRLRDELAVERTHLANERTLLAYIRTALASAAGGAALLQFFPAYSALVTLAWLLVIAGAAMLPVGLLRFYKVRGQLNADRRDPR
jgi:putative membrane protein